jgi:hypothetical protein
MPDLARAYFIRTADESGGSAAPASEGSGVSNAPATVPPKAVAVQFNPLTLQYGLTINNPQAGAQPQSTQHVARAEATLEMDLSFDTTHDGTDVRALTVPVRNLAMSGEAPSGAEAGRGSGGGAGGGRGNAADQAPPKVAFVWGTFRFVGVVSGFRETLDFFSAEGVPLRSGVHVSLRGTQNSEAFQPAGQRAGLGSGLGNSLGNLGREDASAARAAGAALGAGSLRIGLSAGVGGGAGAGPGLSVGASVSVSSSASAATSSAALGRLAQVSTQGSAGAATPPLGGEFGFGGVVQGSEPSGLRSRLGVLDFSSSSE